MRTTLRLLRQAGITPKKWMQFLKHVVNFRRDWSSFAKQAAASKGEFPFGNHYPCLYDRNVHNGPTRDHYFLQDLAVAIRIHKNNPIRHVDIGSRIDGFVAHVASFRKIEVLDIRQMNSEIQNIVFRQMDFMEPIPSELFNYCDSASSLHAIEHFGLGRYGDKLSYYGHLDGLKNLYDILKPQGKLYFSVPIGPQRIEFNAHRVFSMQYLLSYFRGKYLIDRLCVIDDAGIFHEYISIDTDKIADNYGCNYGCGIFELTKI
jgi:SAM-dependent methyltransferase